MFKPKLLPILLGFMTATLSSSPKLTAENFNSLRYCAHSYLTCTISEQGTVYFGTWAEDGPAVPTQNLNLE